MTSNMVALGSEPSDGVQSTARYPLLATSRIPLNALFPIPKWAPRTGRTDAYVEWWRGVVQLASAFGLTEADLSDVPLNAEPYTPLDRSAADRKPATPGATAG